MKKIMWCITGAGAYLRDVVYSMLDIREKYGLKITLCFSKWGFEVTRMYGLHSVLSRVSSGGYYEEWFVDDQGFYHVGRVNLKKYDLVVLAPATSNTVAKLIHGIADTLPTLVFSQALKSNTPIVVFPSDAPSKNGYVCSETPCFIDVDLCKCMTEGRECILLKYCPVRAISTVDGSFARIDLSKCTGCGICMNKCVYSAVKCWLNICVKPSDLDLRNIEYLSRFENVYVVRTISVLKDTVVNILGLR